jgi:ribosomal protein S18 acetylase RimI-like enzyme
MLEVFNGSNFDAVYDIMQKSFPNSEIRSKNGQRALLKDKRYTIYCYKKNGALVGVLCAWEIGVGCFLEHFAVLPEFRGCGIGADMLQEFINKRKNQGGFIFLEAEPITDELTARRVAFYKRNGFLVNDYEYCQPAFSPTLPAVPLKILTYGKAINEQEFNRVKSSVYVEVYNQPE